MSAIPSQASLTLDPQEGSGRGIGGTRQVSRAARAAPPPAEILATWWWSIARHRTCTSFNYRRQLEKVSTADTLRSHRIIVINRRRTQYTYDDKISTANRSSYAIVCKDFPVTIFLTVLELSSLTPYTYAGVQLALLSLCATVSLGSCDVGGFQYAVLKRVNQFLQGACPVRAEQVPPKASGESKNRRGRKRDSL